MNEKTLDDNKNIRGGDQAWVFLAEISFPELLRTLDTEDERKQDSPNLLTRELDIPSECLLKLAQISATIAREAVVRFKQEKIAIPVSFRLFCQKKMIDEQMSGGWSYFLIERTKACSNGHSGISQRFVDLYIYREGN